MLNREEKGLVQELPDDKLRGEVDLDSSQLKIEMGPQLMITKELKRDGQNILKI